MGGEKKSNFKEKKKKEGCLENYDFLACSRERA